MQCRCCLSRQLPLFELFELNLDLILTSVARVAVQRNDGLPEFACEECVTKAKAALKFKQQCERVDQSMRRLLRSGGCGLPQGYHAVPSDGLKEAKSNLEKVPVPSDVGDDSLSQPFDHGYCRSFNHESLEVLDECLELEEQFLEQEIQPDGDFEEVREQFDGIDGEFHDEVTSTSTSTSGILCLDALGEFIEMDKFEDSPATKEVGAPTNQCNISEQEQSIPHKTSSACLQEENQSRRTMLAPQRERERYVCDCCGRKFARLAFMKRHTARCTSKTDLQRGTREQLAVLFCEKCARTFQCQSFLHRHRHICKGPAEFDFLRDVVDRFTNKEFQQHFRMSRTTVDFLVDSFQRSEFYRVRIAGGRPEISARAQILSFLWFCGKNTTFGKVSRVFRISMSSFHKHMSLILDFMHKMAGEVIKMPTRNEEMRQLSLQFAKIIPITNVLGCIDSCLISCVRYKEPEAETNTKQCTRSTILLHAIADSKGKFMDVDTEQMLSTKVDDGRLFSCSAIARRLENLCQNSHFHLLGSSPYPLRTYLLTPFVVMGKNSNSKLPTNDPKVITFNKTLNIALENSVLKAFCALMRRFPMLVKLRFFSREKMDRFILACCVLHNVCIDAGDVLVVGNEYHVTEMEDEVETSFSVTTFWQRPCSERTTGSVGQLIEAGKAKRDQILMSLIEQGLIKATTN